MKAGLVDALNYAMDKVLDPKCDWCGRISNYPKEKNGKTICPDCYYRYYEEENTGAFGSYRRGD